MLKTVEYSMFKVNENQPMHRKHKKDLCKSIIKSGGNIIPILINSDMTIIDGHGRYKCCVENNLPILYMYSDVKDISMSDINTSQTQWSIKDYAEHYSSLDYNYKMLFDRLYANMPSSVFQSIYGIGHSHIKNGNKLDIIDWDYVDYFWNICKDIMKISGAKTKNGVVRAVGYLAYEMIDLEKLMSQVKKHWLDVYEYGTIDGDSGMMFALSNIYDHKQKTKHNLYYKIKAKG